MKSLRAIGGLIRATASDWWNDNTFRLSASLAFYTIFSIAPVLLIAVSVVGWLFGEEEVRRHLLAEIQDLTGEDGAEAVGAVLEQIEFDQESLYAALTGLGVLLLGSTVVFVDLQSSLNMIWDVRVAPTRNMIRGFLRDRLISFAIVVGVGFLLLLSLVSSTALAAAQELLPARFPGVTGLWRAADALATFAMAVLLFAMVYKVLPDVRLNWRDVAIGALVTALLFSVGRYAIGAYLGQMAFASRYGAAGSFVVLMFWIYYSSLVCFLGAEFTQVYARRYGAGIRTKAHAQRVGNKPDRC